MESASLKGLLSKFSKNFGIEKPEFRFGKDGQVYYSPYERWESNSTIFLISSQITLFEGSIICDNFIYLCSKIIDDINYIEVLIPRFK